MNISGSSTMTNTILHNTPSNTRHILSLVIDNWFKVTDSLYKTGQNKNKKPIHTNLESVRCLLQPQFDQVKLQE